jgi:glycosyltransferase involved in cell wall biosynthesis
MSVPIIIHTFHGHVFHSYFGYLKTKFYIFLERYLASKSSAIIAISKLQKDELIDDFKICSPDKMHVIPLGFDLEKFQSNVDLNRDLFRKEFGLLDEEIAIGIVGRLTPIKNHTFFLKAIQNIQNKTSNKFKVFIIGDGEDKEYIQNLANEFHLKNNLSDQENPLIYFTSWRKDMDVVYAGLDIVALTSLNEGTPVTLIEAQAANKPIVSTNVGGVLDVVLEGITANTCSREDINSFSKNLSDLIDNNYLRKKMGSSGYNHVTSLFSYRRLVKDVSILYKNLLIK